MSKIIDDPYISKFLKAGFIEGIYIPPPFLNTNIMSRINVKREDLIKVLNTNRDKHQQEYDEAYAGYLQLCIEALEEKIVVVNDAAKALKDGPEETFDMYFNDLMQAPENHVQDYQDVIDMLELSEDTKLSVGMEEYKKYYKNDWTWSRSWELSNKMYVDKFHDM